MAAVAKKPSLVPPKADPVSKNNTKNILIKVIKIYAQIYFVTLLICLITQIQYWIKIKEDYSTFRTYKPDRITWYFNSSKLYTKL